MPRPNKKAANKPVEKVFFILASIATITLLTMGGLAWWAYSFTTTMVRTELAAQKIYFPEKGSAAFDPTEFPDIQQYAGQLVDTGPEARAYANGFIGRHLKKIANGKTYSEVSADAQKDPTNQKLQQQKATLFQGETLRGMLLGDGYAFWMIGDIARVAGIVLFVASGIMAVLSLILVKHIYGVQK
jgi:hypothetical protein